VYSGAMKLTDSVDNSPIDAGKLVLSQQELCRYEKFFKGLLRMFETGTVLAVRKKFYILLK
jgi:hypothetical protein